MSISDTADGGPDSLTLSEIIEEEKLFEEYLAIRAQQAATEMEAALQNSARDPAAAAQAKRVVAEAQAELAAQRRRVAEAEQAITRIRTKRPTPPPKRPKVTGRKSNRTRVSKPRKKATTESIQTRTSRSHAVLIAPQHPAVPQPLAAPGNRHTNKNPTRAKPKTERTRRASRASGNVPNRRKPGQAFRPTKIEKVVAPVPIFTVECIVCTARIPASAARCRCGWRVAEGATRLPRASLSATERTALARGSKIAPRGKRRRP